MSLHFTYSFCHIGTDVYYNAVAALYNAQNLSKYGFGLMKSKPTKKEPEADVYSDRLPSPLYLDRGEKFDFTITTRVNVPVGKLTFYNVIIYELFLLRAPFI